MKGGMHGKGGCVCGGGACMAEETATAADGTHPTGMHSCSQKISRWQYHIVNGPSGPIHIGHVRLFC